MHDIKAIRDDFAAFKSAIGRRNLSDEQRAQIDALLALDDALRGAKTAKQEAEASRNAASKQIGAAKAAKDDARASELMAQVATYKTTIEQASEEEAKLSKQLSDILASLPNLPALDVPTGADEEANVEVRRWYKGQGGEPPPVELSADHVTLGEALGMMDFEAAARMSGSRFVALKGQLARLERALAAFMLDLQTETHGYTEVSPPLLVKDNAVFGTGQLPKFEEDLFFASSYMGGASFRNAFDGGRAIGILLDNAQDWEVTIHNQTDEIQLTKIKEPSLGKGRPVHERHFLIPTAEVSLTNLVREQILDESALPLRMTADTPCFRSEAGAAGGATRAA